MTRHPSHRDPRRAAQAEGVVLSAIGRAWDRECRSRFQGTMSRPTLALHEGQGRWGFWRPEDRTLSLSRGLVMAHPWGAVLEVLRHEMAHQYVHEVLGVRETPHGPVFQRVCAERGIDGSAAGLLSEVGEEPAVLRRIRKVLARADGPDTAEARTASRLAWRMMARHGVEEAALRAQAGVVARVVGPSRARHPTWWSLLMGVLGSTWSVEVTRIASFDVARDAQGTAFELVGTPAQVAIAEHVVAWFEDAAARAWRGHQRTTGARGAAAKNRYLEGLVLGFRDRMADEADRAEQEEGLVLVGSPEVEAFAARRYPGRRAGRRMRVRTDGDHAAGRAAGRALRWRRPIGGTQGERGVAGRVTGPSKPGSRGG